MNQQVIFLGTEIKLRIEMEPIEDINMSDCYFILEAYSGNNKNKIILKKQGEYKDKAVISSGENAYIFLIDSAQLGVGNLKCKLTLKVKDGDFNDYWRTEVSILNPNILIKDEKML
jgi:hypothetical protein